jgi:hypothetical protein
MKHLFSFTLALFLTFTLTAQDDDLYLIFELMRVDESQMNDYWETEELWSGIHQQRANAGDIIGWDLWSLQPSGEDQGYQFMTVTLFSSFKDMISGGGNFVAHAKAAYPEMSENELMKKFNSTPEARDLAIRLFLQQIDHTEGDFDMPVGTFASMDFMQELDDDYEEAESNIFKPWHQEMVDNGQKGSWDLLRILFPAGSDRYASHMTVNMYEDAAQFADSGGPGMGNMDMVTEMGLEEALKTRDMKKVYMARLEMKVRAE